MGISPKIWGPNAWTFIHLMVLSEKEPFDSSRLKYYEQFFTLLTVLLPCETCRNHLIENIGKMTKIESIQTKRELFNWTVDLHNRVNQILGIKPWDSEKAYHHWIAISEGKRSYTGEYCYTNYWKYTTILLIILMIVYTMFNYKGLRKNR
jgi:hypothetical protein